MYSYSGIVHQREKDWTTAVCISMGESLAYKVKNAMHKRVNAMQFYWHKIKNKQNIQDYNYWIVITFWKSEG